jgi:hypothetical protein
MDTSTNYIYGLEALLGIGGGVFIQASYAVIQAVTDPADMSYGISFIMIGTSLLHSRKHRSQTNEPQLKSEA